CAQSQAKAPFDQALSQLEGAGSCPPAALLNAHALGDTLVAGQSTPGSLDALDEAIYCDATSGTLIDPAGSASSGGSGFVPSTARHLRCSDAVGSQREACARPASISPNSSRWGTPPSPRPSRRAGSSSSAPEAPRRPPRRPPAPLARSPRPRGPQLRPPPPPPRCRQPRPPRPR